MNLIEYALAHGDGTREGYEALLDSFYKAHDEAPGGISIEVGTRRGGSALMQLKALQSRYECARQPQLVTIDPYGDKPYMVTQGYYVPNLYGDSEYVAAKNLLAGYANHVHFSVTSLDFLAATRAGMALWHCGQRLPLNGGVGVATHVFLDGDHDVSTVLMEIHGFLPLLKLGGRLLIDNVDDDPHLLPRLLAAGFTQPTPKMAGIQRTA